MKKKILIFGSGSIGTHHANAAISLGCEVFVTDIKKSQMMNMKNNIYPERYGKWNNKIKFVEYNNVFKLKDKFDLIIIGTPPITHLGLIKQCANKFIFKKILVEKPLYVFNQDHKYLLKKKIKNKIFCGFNHSISKSFNYFLFELRKIMKKENSNLKLNIQWKESFNLVLKAHPWVKSIKDSYLSNYKKGGGVSHEYSHAIHFLVILKNIFFNKKKISFNKKINFKQIKQNVSYDSRVNLCFFDRSNVLNLSANSINNPPVKKIIVNLNKKKLLEWIRDLNKGVEIVNNYLVNKKIKIFKINRRDDFINELALLLKKNKGNNVDFLKISYALEVNKILKKIFIKNVQKI